MFGSAPLNTAFRHGRGNLGGAAGRGKIPASQTTIPGLLQCTSQATACNKRRILGTVCVPQLRHGLSALNALVRTFSAIRPASCLTGLAEA